MNFRHPQIQLPLLVPSEPLNIRLVFAQGKEGKVFALEKRSQAGLLGQQLWFPVNATTERVRQYVITSAEGGRFWQYRIRIELYEAQSPREFDDMMPTDAVWISEKVLAALVAAPLCTSLELRMAWSLVKATD
jgi:hypothetical protein